MKLLNIEWFKTQLSSLFREYKLNYRFFAKGDFGDLDEVTFENNNKIGAIQFWELGYMHILLIDLINDTTQINILLNPEQHSEKLFEIEKLLEAI